MMFVIPILELVLLKTVEFDDFFFFNTQYGTCTQDLEIQTHVQ